MRSLSNDPVPVFLDEWQWVSGSSASGIPLLVLFGGTRQDYAAQMDGSWKRAGILRGFIRCEEYAAGYAISDRVYQWSNE